MAQYMIAIGRGFGEWIPEAYPSSPRSYRRAWNDLSLAGYRLLGFQKVWQIGGVYQEPDEKGQPLVPTEAWTMVSNDDHFKMMKGS